MGLCLRGPCLTASVCGSVAKAYKISQNGCTNVAARIISFVLVVASRFLLMVGCGISFCLLREVRFAKKLLWWQRNTCAFFLNGNKNCNDGTDIVLWAVASSAVLHATFRSLKKVSPSVCCASCGFSKNASSFLLFCSGSCGHFSFC